MTWRDQLQQASFRGVPFYTRTTSSQAGRRMALHEYPQRDLPYAEDLGRKARSFTIEGYVIGPNYMAARDALLAALEQPGAGTLVHPYRGTLNVALMQPATITESADEGGMARFSMIFTEAGDNQNPTVTADTPSLVASKADAAQAVLASDFASQFVTVGFPDYIAQAAQAVSAKVFSTLASLGGSLPMDPANLAELALDASRNIGSLNALIQNPALLATGMLNSISALGSFATNASDALSILGNLVGFGSNSAGAAPAYVAPITPSQAQNTTNQAAITNLVRRSALIEAARASSQVTFASYNEAMAVREDLSTRLDDEMVGVAAGIVPAPAPGTWAPTTEVSDDLYQALADLRVAVIRDISARGATLSPLTTFTAGRALPAVVLAHRLYGAADRAEDIVARNHVANPLFVPGGVALEVLSV
jgi:prophage DNA circulation protein